MAKELVSSRHKAFAFTWLIPMVMAVCVTIGVQLLCQWAWQFRLSVPAKLGLYFSVHFFSAWLLKRYIVNQFGEGGEQHPGLNWPRPGIHRYLGRYGMVLTALPSMALTLLNPILLFQQIKLLACQLSVGKRVSTRATDIAGYKNKVCYRLPFEGRWLVYNGGNSPATSHSWDVLSQRYALDFVMVDHTYSRHKNNGLAVQDYYCFNQPIVAAAEGEVISVFDRVAQAPLPGFGLIDFLCCHFAGNHVVIKHAPGEYGFYAHLKKGSISVKPGDRVGQGELLGVCGFNGFTSEPHLHFHLQDHPDIYCAMGLPVKFTGVEGEGVHSDPVHISRGMQVIQRK
ncbi:M23 family metallopeptidase [Pseudoalteromonas rubra]|uniref:M23 family metallopeptidase n=1 Tax=Pseudoalteromonas rubra TaxID=43658 RepID=UPI000F77C2AB|nr:M23 family metallopeptidase [Pseudoalteromonas rubra]